MKGFSGGIFRSTMYVEAEPFLFEMRRWYQHGAISWQEARTLKGQALAGDLDGARKGLAKLVKRREAHTCGNTQSG